MLKNRIVYLLLLTAVFFFFLYFNGYLSLLLLTAVLILPVLSLALTLAASWGITADAIFSPPLARKKEAVRLELSVKSRNILPVSAMRIHLEIANGYLGKTEKQQYLFPLGSRGQTLLEQAFSSQYCGSIRAVVKRAVIYDYFRLFALPKKLRCSAVSFILPSGSGLRSGQREFSWEGAAVPAQKFGDPDAAELSGLREFRDGDRLRDVHWKLSSKLDRLMTKEYEHLQECRVFIVLERLAADADLLDAEAEAAAAITRRLTELRVRHKVYWQENCGWKSCIVENDSGYHLMIRQFLSSDSAERAAQKFPPLENGCFLLYLSIFPDETLCKECSFYQGQTQVIALTARNGNSDLENLFQKAGVPLAFWGDQEAGVDETGDK